MSPNLHPAGGIIYNLIAFFFIAVPFLACLSLTVVLAAIAIRTLTGRLPGGPSSGETA
jgi:hypothetical protein